MITDFINLLKKANPSLEVILGYKTPNEIPAELHRGCVVVLLQSSYEFVNQSVNEVATLQAVYFETGVYDDIELFKARAEELFFYVTLHSTYVLEKIEFSYNDIYLFAVATFSVKRKI